MLLKSITIEFSIALETYLYEKINNVKTLHLLQSNEN